MCDKTWTLDSSHFSNEPFFHINLLSVFTNTFQAIIKDCYYCKIVAITKNEDPDGIKRCKIFLDDTIIKTTPMRKKPFQGWRYLKKNRTPSDIADPVTGTFEDDIPLEVQQQLLEVGLL